jgi:hypothetical protein
MKEGDILEHVDISKEIKKNVVLAVAMTVTLSFVASSFAYVNVEEILKERATIEVENIISDVPEDVVPAEDIIKPKPVGDEYVASSDTVYAEIPKKAEDGLYLRDYDSDVKLSVSLPEEVYFENDGTNTDDMVVYNEEDVAVAVDVVDGGIRQTYIIKDKDSPREFTVNYAGTEGLSYLEFAQDSNGNTDGSVLLKDINGNVFSVVAVPWAKDAAGINVFTYYEIDGFKLTQIVQPTADTQYPIVADPLSITSSSKSNKQIKETSVLTLSLNPRPIVRVSDPAILSSFCGFTLSNAVRKASWDSIYDKHKRSSN